MTSKHTALKNEKAQMLRRALRGDSEAEEIAFTPPVPVEPSKALTVAENVVDVLETLPDVNHNQRRIAFMLANNRPAPEIAARCGITASYVRALSVDERIQELIKIFRGGTIYKLAEDLSASEVLNRAKVRAAEVLAEKMNSALDEGNQLRSAIKILEATGEIGRNAEAIVEIKIDQDTIRLYQKAKQSVIEDADYEVIDGDVEN